MLSAYRIEIQDRVRRSGREPTENDQINVDRMRQVVISQIALMESLQAATISGGQIDDDPQDTCDESQFDNMDNLNPSVIDSEDVNDPYFSNENDDMAAGIGSSNNIIRPERKNISIPSRWKSIHNIYSQLELNLRLLQAAKILSALRDLIAEKSFQFSHVIRVAPRKGVRTRARSAIAKVNAQVAFYCRLYTQCRTAMVKLGADDIILNRFRVLERQDIASSTALLNPNEPGSTRQRLSWIWLSGHTEYNQESLGLYECKSQFLFSRI